MYYAWHMKKSTVELNEVEYFTDVVRIKYAITVLMKKHNLIDEIVVDNRAEKVNSFYGRIVKNGAYAIEFSRGVPSMIYTPFGSVGIESAKFCRGSLTDYKDFLSELDKNFGLVEKEPVVKDRFNQVGPLCAIARLPWKDKNKFPTEFEDLSLTTDSYDYGSVEEEQHVAEIYRAVNEQFVKKGHSEMVASQPKPKAPKAVVNEPKKRKCIIWEQIKNWMKKRPEKEF